MIFETSNAILVGLLDPLNPIVAHLQHILRFLREISMIIMIMGICLSIKNAIKTANTQRKQKSLNSTSTSINANTLLDKTTQDISNLTFDEKG